jgi:kynurenine formamidase
LDEQSPYWPEGEAAVPLRATTIATHKPDGYYVRTLEFSEHFGTHIDAPIHFDPRGKSLDEIPAEDLLLPAVVVDVRAAVALDPDYCLRVEDLEEWKKAHGPFPPGCAVLMLSGWSSRWPSQERYLNQDRGGVMHFPGFSLESAQYLLNQVRPKAIGIDTMSVDYGPSRSFEVHALTLGAGLYHVECLANLEELPATGALLIALPLKLRGGSGGPARVMAIV